MPVIDEIKRKLFHHLSLVYLILYALLPRWGAILLLGLVLIVVGALEFLRLRRPELNAWLLGKFRGIHREAEVMSPSGVFWTLFGCWLTMVIFVDKLIGVTGIGYLVFGDTAAALVGKTYGKRRWPKNPQKTIEGSAAFVGVAFLWGLLMVRPHAALVGALFTAWVESARAKLNDNFWIPLAGAFSVSVCYGGKVIHGNPYVYLLGRTLAFTLINLAAAYVFIYRRKESSDAV